MMPKNPLQIVYTDHAKDNTPPSTSKTRVQREEIQAIMERSWLQDPEQFNPMRDCMEKKRVDKTIAAIQSVIILSNKHAVDLGCGSGIISRIIRNAGAFVDAVDIASQALQQMQKEDMSRITAKQECLPTTSLKDQSYDLVICTELIAYLKATNYRMLMAELARLVKNDGYVVCSTALDINTENPLERFITLVETEFTVDKWLYSYHLLQLRLCRFFEKPAQYIKSSNIQEYRHQELAKRTGIRRKWFSFNTQFPANIFWKIIQIPCSPIAYFFRQNVWMMNILEKITQFFWSDAGISHVLFIGKKRPIVFPVKADQAPRELKHKRQVWE